MPKYRIEFGDRFEGLLDSTAKSESIAPEANKPSEVIRRAVALYVFLHKEVAEGLQLAIIDKESGQIRKIIDPLP